MHLDADRLRLDLHASADRSGQHIDLESTVGQFRGQLGYPQRLWRRIR